MKAVPLRHFIFIIFCAFLIAAYNVISFATAIWIKITSPSAGQKIGLGELEIKGSSSDNSTSDCQVYADWNNQKPYQRVIPTGKGGSDDFSTWSYTYNSSYHLIKEGTNDLTSKISCAGSPSNPLSKNKWYSINVTGTGGQSNAVQLPLPTEASAGNNERTLSLPSNQSNDLNSPIQIKLEIGNDRITPGTKQTLTVEAVNPSTGDKMSDAEIQVRVTDPSGNIIKKFDTRDGDLSRSFKIGSNPLGNYVITADVRSGMGAATKSVTFTVQ